MIVTSFLTAAELATLRDVARASTLVWSEGRQETGYYRAAVDAAALGLDALLDRSLAALGVDRAAPHDVWLLRYPHGASIPPHVDPSPKDGQGHHRLNAVVVAPRAGGVLTLDGAPCPLGAGDAVVFRPDVQRHQLSAVDGERLVWSVGCLKAHIAGTAG